MAKPFKRVLVANRGEIAVRVIRACKELGLETVQVYSDADRESLAVRLADRAVCIGPPRSAQSYLNAEFIVSAALIHGADAIHPGYGFLSENAHFARLCEKEGVTFIGPSAEVIALMGDKAMARRMAQEADVPTTPGSTGTVDNAAHAEAVAATLGYPVILKAAAGGGGRGMRIVWAEEELESQFLNAAREAKAAFNDDSIYVEKYLTAIRHIEIQILSDGQNVLHLGERDCSIQRRNQKLVEESPSPVLDDAVRKQLGEAAVRLCRHVRYKNAGTIEYILDGTTGQFYFMEMNTRVQVEHPVTELVTGIDIVKEQIGIAQGNSLVLTQADIGFRGHAIECRINAEDSDNGFAPCPGTIQHFHAPGGPGIRVDSHIFTGYPIPPYYDSLLAKVIAWGHSRDEALERMRRALWEMRIDGVKTTLPFHQSLLRNEQFRRGDVHTKFVEETVLETK
ncbi:acetyl-CoA carboxylase biotin carboxylase subunit [Trinickia mobilis]|uniref:acetyl-CoA carboxylase biotin carboxylase subunit n=1 Tax=Trinickia mobilis TaxID=2816356 RepID=UPI001A8E8736|nr:acetyl-CoA carboxylase biotin carboxylase subunit [Trinickia mobilis]